ncbi:MAG: HigA family addiction module antidote protein [Dolichospermum sp. LBC05a]|nr:HigA family addiction module antidote protein [Dolichospermum sp. OL01]MCO5796782.1 HigA family addiction module antidote protein [Dolichospermum sp. OL03]MCS6281284.1 HigA family addiction module antidote protein [Dolichospermum sp.]QSV61137.1 MAG: HigA family addiction module antidote protein [Dolichospermum sp. LBC05a]
MGDFTFRYIFRFFSVHLLILDDLDINPSNFAEILGVSNQIIQEIINGEKSITVDIAIRLGKALGNGQRLWLNLQQKVDVWDALQDCEQLPEKP